jgi:hypothetical protein
MDAAMHRRIPKRTERKLRRCFEKRVAENGFFYNYNFNT